MNTAGQTNLLTKIKKITMKKMTAEEKKEKLKLLVSEMLIISHESMIKKIDSILNSGAIDVDGWDENISPMIIPKCIIAALLEYQSTQFYGRGTSYEKQMKSEIRNIRYFIPS